MTAGRRRGAAHRPAQRRRAGRRAAARRLTPRGSRRRVGCWRHATRPRPPPRPPPRRGAAHPPRPDPGRRRPRAAPVGRLRRGAARRGLGDRRGAAGRRLPRRRRSSRTPSSSYGDLAVITRPGADERQPETAGTEETLRGLGYRIARIEAPGHPRRRRRAQARRHRVGRPRRAHQPGRRRPAGRPPRAAGRPGGAGAGDPGAAPQVRGHRAARRHRGRLRAAGRRPGHVGPRSCPCPRSPGRTSCCSAATTRADGDRRARAPASCSRSAGCGWSPSTSPSSRSSRAASPACRSGCADRAASLRARWPRCAPAASLVWIQASKKPSRSSPLTSSAIASKSSVVRVAALVRRTNQAQQTPRSRPRRSGCAAPGTSSPPR